MRILYVFPHPDDESFGPASVMSKQRREGHEIFLLTLTRGGATKVRHELGYSVEQMGELRYREMLQMEKVLGLAGMQVLDLPDSGLKEMDPRDLETVVSDHILQIQPAVVVSYPVHGISGFHDHLVMHAVAKRAFLSLRSLGVQYLKRLAFYTLGPANLAGQSSIFNLQASKPEEIDCVIQTDPEDLEKMKEALACYGSYTRVVQDSKVVEITGSTHHFEFFQERFDPPLSDLFDKLPR